MKTIIALLVLCHTFVAFGEEKKQIDFREAARQADTKFRVAGHLMWTAAAVDLASTEYAIVTGAGREGNPLLKNRAVRIASKVGVTYMIDKITENQHANNHPDLAFWCRLGTAIAWGFVAGWNFTVAF